jgi:hypothetical protein
MRRDCYAKLIATLGPASSSATMIRTLFHESSGGRDPGRWRADHESGGQQAVLHSPWGAPYLTTLR